MAYEGQISCARGEIYPLYRLVDRSLKKVI